MRCGVLMAGIRIVYDNVLIMVYTVGEESNGDEDFDSGADRRAGIKTFKLTVARSHQQIVESTVLDYGGLRKWQTDIFVYNAL